MKRGTRYIFGSRLLLAFVCGAVGQTPTPPSNKNPTEGETKSAQKLKLEDLSTPGSRPQMLRYVLTLSWPYFSVSKE